jgi:hypothetical protein
MSDNPLVNYIQSLHAETTRLKARVQEQNERIEQLLRDNADLKSALALLEELT